MSKRILSLVAVVTLLVTMFAFMTSASAIYTAYSHCANGKPLNVRSGPGKNYAVIGEYAYGEAIAIDHDLGNGWSEVIRGSVPGYVMTALITKTYPGKYDPSKHESGGETSGSGLNSIYQKARLVTPYTVILEATRTSKGLANVRWAPSKNATLLKAYTSGTQVTVIAEFDGNWYQVQDPVSGAVGFVNRAYIVK